MKKPPPPLLASTLGLLLTAVGACRLGALPVGLIAAALRPVLVRAPRAALPDSAVAQTAITTAAAFSPRWPSMKALIHSPLLAYGRPVVPTEFAHFVVQLKSLAVVCASG